MVKSLLIRNGYRIGQAFALNLVASVLIVCVYLAITVLSIVSAEDELREISEKNARRWVENALLQSDVVATLFNGEPPAEEERALLATLARGGHIFRFDAFDLSGKPIVSFENGVFRDPGRLRSDPGLIVNAARGASEVDIRNGTAIDGLPEHYAVLDIPLVYHGQVLGAVRLYSDETEAKLVYDEEMVRSIILSSVLAGLALTSSIAIGFLLHRQRRSDARIHHLAHHDPLTGVGNRHQYQEFLSEMMAAVHHGS